MSLTLLAQFWSFIRPTFTRYLCSNSKAGRPGPSDILVGLLRSWRPPALHQPSRRQTGLHFETISVSPASSISTYWRLKFLQCLATKCSHIFLANYSQKFVKGFYLGHGGFAPDRIKLKFKLFLFPSLYISNIWLHMTQMYDAFSKVGNFRDISPFGFHRSLTGSWRAQLARPPDRIAGTAWTWTWT